MATRLMQTNFTAGELDPRLMAQNRLKAYFNGAEAMRNVIVQPQGGFRLRPGLMKVLDVLVNAADEYLPIAFNFNAEQLYLLVFGDLRFDVIIVDPTGYNDIFISSGAQPYTAAQLPLVNWAQSADTLLTVHPDVAPYRFIRISHSSWSVAAIPFTNIPNFDFGSGPEPVMSATRGWPRAITFFQQRLWLAGLRSRPQTILASKTGDFLNLDTGTTADDDGLDFTLDTDQINPIVNLHAGKSLQIFTTGSEFIVDPGAAPVTPKNVVVREQTRRGSKPGVRPGELDGATYYVQYRGRALRQFAFVDTEQVYKATNISIVAPHLIIDPRSLAVRKSSRLDDADFILMANSDGTATVFTSLREEEVKAFTLLSTAGDFRRVATSEGSPTFWLVRRNIAGVTKTFIERWRDDGLTDCAVFATRPAPTESIATAGQTVFNWNAGVSVTAIQVRRNGVTIDPTGYSVAGLPGASGTIILNTPAAAGDAIRITYPLAILTGLAHLNGLQVVAIVDGAYQQAKIVTAGAIPLDPPAETVAEAGLPFSWLVKTMPVENETRDGSTMVGRKARIVRATVRLHETKGLKVNGQVVPFRRTADVPLSPLDVPPPARSGDFRISGLQGWSDRAQLTLNNDNPLPVNVLGIAYTVQV
jgi:hypothetical protein